MAPVSLATLARRRALYVALEQARCKAEVVDNGSLVAFLDAELARQRVLEVEVVVPCVTCERPFPVPVAVDDNAVPVAALCSPCSATL